MAVLELEFNESLSSWMDGWSTLVAPCPFALGPGVLNKAVVGQKLTEFIATSPGVKDPPK
jgi:hypothetical protein